MEDIRSNRQERTILMKISYTFSHKDAKLDNYYIENNYIKIDTRNLNGYSIGNLNSIYNEFCGMYWLWHN